MVGILSHIVLRSRTRGRLIGWLRDCPKERDQCLHLLLRERFAPRGHHPGLSHCASTEGDGVAQQLIAHGVQDGPVIRQWRLRINVGAVGWRAGVASAWHQTQ